MDQILKTKNTQTTSTLLHPHLFSVLSPLLSILRPRSFFVYVLFPSSSFLPPHIFPFRFLNPFPVLILYPSLHAKRPREELAECWQGSDIRNFPFYISGLSS